MIEIISGIMNVPESERFIGFTGDNLHTKKQFLLVDTANENCIYRLYLSFDDGTTNHFVLDSKVENGSTLLTWDVRTEHIFKSGIVNAQIKCFLESGEIYHTQWDYFYVAQSAESDQPFKDNENAEFLRYEKELNEILEKVESGMCVPINRKIAGLSLESDIKQNNLCKALGTYPIIFNFADPDKYIIGYEKQLCISEIFSDAPKLFICAGQRENGDYIWKNVSTYVSQEHLKNAVQSYLDDNPVSGSGKSAYEIAVENGFEGTQEQWLESLKADVPTKGVDYFTVEDKAEFINELANDVNVGGRIDELYDIVYPLKNESLNIFNKENVVLNKNRYLAVGRLITDTFDKMDGFMTSTSFRCKKGDVIRSNISWQIESIVYDNDGVCVEKTYFDDSKQYTVTSDNAVQFTIQASKQSLLSTLMITINNDMPSVYTPYSKNLVDKVSDIDAQIKSSQKYFKKPFVVLSFDAFNLTDNRFSIVNDEYGYKATVANTTNESTNKAMMKAGWDIGLYRLDNYPPDMFDYDEAVSQTPSQEVLAVWDNYVKTTIENAESYGVYNPTVWLTRQGCSCFGLETALKKYNIPMCRGSYNPDYSNDTQYFADKLPTMTVSCKQTLMPSTLEDCKTAVADAVNNNTGVAFLTHGIYNTDSSANSNYGITESALRSFLDAVKTYVDAGQLEVLTYRDVYKRFYPDNAYERDYNRMYKVFTGIVNGNEVAY